MKKEKLALMLRKKATLLCLGLIVIAVMLLYFQVVHFEFLNWDDPDYITRNKHVSHGVTWNSLSWAVTTYHAANWHPLTWLSLMLDVSVFGVSAGALHLTNAIIHALTCGVIFLVLLRCGLSRTASLILTSFFALHPLRAESVAWVSERKDVLCAFFFMAATLAYLKYGFLRSLRWYSIATVFFILALLSKPMAITWPLVVLALDYWPLGRFSDRQRVLIEKIPWVVLSMLLAALTIFAQNEGKAVKSLEYFPLGKRIANAGLSYVTYLKQTLWPFDLTVFYPYPESVSIIGASLAWIVIALVTVLLFLKRRTYPHVLVGWMIFLITLLPVIGFIQVGLQAHADRYTYIPSLGILLAISSVCTFAKQRQLFLTMCSLLMIGLAFLTWRQVGYWKSNQSLFNHNLKVAGANYLAHFNLATHYSERGNLEEAEPHFLEAARLHPDDADIYNNLGNLYQQQAKYEVAAEVYRKALKISMNPVFLFNLGNCYTEMARFISAEACYKEAIARDPLFATAHYRLGKLHTRTGRYKEAVKEFDEALRLEPGWSEAVALRETAWTMLQGELKDSPFRVMH